MHCFDMQILYYDSCNVITWVDCLDVQNRKAEKLDLCMYIYLIADDV